MSVVKT